MGGSPWLPASERSERDLAIAEICLFIIAILGNSIVCIVIIGSKSMHTVTNCYLFNLSISDILLVILRTFFDENPFLPIEFEKAHFSLAIRSLAKLIIETTMFVSIVTITAFTTERYLAICHPLYTYTTSKIRATKKLLIVIWFFCAVFALPKLTSWFFAMNIISFETHELIAAIRDDITAIVFNIVPLVAIAAMYTCIGLKIFRRNKMLRGNSITIADRSQKTTLAMMGIIVIIIAISWSPAFIFKIVENHAPKSLAGNFVLTVDDDLYFTLRVTRVIFLISPAVNPIIYSLMSKKFRKAFKEIFIDRNWWTNQKLLVSQKSPTTLDSSLTVTKINGVSASSIKLPLSNREVYISEV